MSGSIKDNQMIIMGLAAVAAAGLLYVAFNQQKKAAEEKIIKKLPGDDDAISQRSEDAISGRSEDTAKRSNTNTATDSKTESKTLDEKTLHAKIEEFDKKGKAYFKNKQVRTIRNLGRWNSLWPFGELICLSPSFAF
jgi:hypothetical protein